MVNVGVQVVFAVIADKVVELLAELARFPTVQLQEVKV